MDVNLSDYVDRYLINYIVYHPQNFTSRGDTAIAYSTFENEYKAARSEMKLGAVEQQAEAINAAMRLHGTNAIKSIALVNALAEGNLLESTLDTIADALNATIDQVSVQSMDSIINSAYSFSGMLAGGAADAAQVNAFFNEVLRGLSMTYGFNSGITNRLIEIGKAMTGDANFSLTSTFQGQTFTMTADDVRNANQIITYLGNAANKLKQDGSVSAESFRGTIRNVFQTGIAERLAAILLGSALDTGISTFEQELQARNANITVNQPSIKMGGRSKEGRKTSKVDVFNSPGFQLQVQINGQTATIEVATNMSVKWYKNAKNIGDIHIISDTPFREVYPFGTPEGYLASNVVVHGHDETKADSGIGASYKMLRASIAASFFNDWLSGSGQVMSGNIDKAQFLMVNGKVYSIMSIVNNVCEGLIRQKKNEFQKVLGISISGIDNIRNDWQGGRDETHAPPSVGWARLRSELVNQALNNITISASFNSKYLTQH